MTVSRTEFDGKSISLTERDIHSLGLDALVVPAFPDLLAQMTHEYFEGIVHQLGGSVHDMGADTAKQYAAKHGLIEKHGLSIQIT